VYVGQLASLASGQQSDFVLIPEPSQRGGQSRFSSRIWKNWDSPRRFWDNHSIHPSPTVFNYARIGAKQVRTGLDFAPAVRSNGDRIDKSSAAEVLDEAYAQFFAADRTAKETATRPDQFTRPRAATGSLRMGGVN
jgi:hypothetical protein